MFIDVPVVNKKGETESYLINTKNINYLRRWKGERGYLQSVVYFNSTEKYIIVDLEREALTRMIVNADPVTEVQ